MFLRRVIVIPIFVVLFMLLCSSSVSAYSVIHQDKSSRLSSFTTSVTEGYTAPCYGDGQAGRRVQAVYAVTTDHPDNYNYYKAQIKNWAGYMDSIVNASAAETGGERHIRWAMDSNCEVDVLKVVVSPTSDDSFNNTKAAMISQGFNRIDRKYVIWFDTTGGNCGVGDLMDDDRADPAVNIHNRFEMAMYARIDYMCWGRSDSAELHELFHTLGAVQLSAPHATTIHHCSDEHELMCYDDDDPTPIQYLCPQQHQLLLDCNHDDYFHTAPAEGSYLATHWNTANSGYLFNQLPTDTQAPSAPAGLSAGIYSPSPSQLPLSWQASTDTGGEVEYRVYRAGQYIGTSHTTNYLDKSVQNGATYQYVVKAYDDAGNVSEASNTVQVIIPGSDTIPPTQPTNPRVDFVTETSLKFSWDPSTDNIQVKWYVICRNGVCGQIFVSPPNSSYTDGGGNIQPGRTYTYTITAYDMSNNPSPTSTIQITTPGTLVDTKAPSVPQSLRTTSVTAQRVDLAWNASTDDVGVAGYRLFRGSTQIASLSGTTYSDTTVVGGTTYVYSVKAFDAAGNVSNASTTLNITVPQPPDTTPPTAPTNLRKGTVKTKSVQLLWNASTDNRGVVRYEIYRNGLWFSFTSGTTTYTDPTVSKNTTYTYFVKAVDAAGNNSPASNQISITTPKR